MSKELIEYDLSGFLPPAQRAYFEDCVLLAPESVLSRLFFMAGPATGVRTGYRVKVSRPDFRGKLRITLGPGSGSIDIDTAGPANIDIRTWRQFTLRISEGTTINRARIICDNADITVGEDGLWSSEVLVQANDQHGIIDTDTMEIINGNRRHIHIGEHVWIGRRTILMPDITIGKGSILGAGAVLTSDMPAHTVFAGVPARKVRENTSWSRSPRRLNDFERRLLEAD